ncbi:MAG: lipocalin-like domain-containing protein [Xanthobacteraceae bacterium]
MKFRHIAAAALMLVTPATAAVAEPAKSLKDRLVGTWTFVVAEVTAPDGKKSFPFGETPKGILILAPDGHFAQIHVASDVPKIASNNRLTGTAEEYATIMRRSISVCSTPTRSTRRRRP